MDESPEYRPVSRLAVAALAVGCCAALAVVSPICWAIPLVGIALSVAALADISQTGGHKAGGLAAVAGLALAVGFGAQAVGAAVVGRWIASQRAETTALAWIESVREARIADALALAERGPGSPPVPAGKEAVDSFAAQPLVKAVQACAAQSRVEGLRVSPDERGEGSWQVRGTLQPCGAGGDTAMSFRIVVAPQTVRRHRGLVERWAVTAFDLER